MTTETKRHTPGPWLCSRFDMDSPWIVCNTKGEWVCKISAERNHAGQSWTNQNPEREAANARFIAAMEQVYEKAMALLNDADGDESAGRMTVDTQTLIELRAAIALAGGKEGT